MRYVTVCTLLYAMMARASAAEVSVTVFQADGSPMAGAVVVAEPAVPAAAVKVPAKAVMDQRNLQFDPDTLVIRTGTAVDFPNSDRVRHQVYSFSGAKTFQLALYSGSSHPPVIFDKAGLVTLGCNIHDGMIGYIYVTDSPWYGHTDATGRVQLHGLPPGQYSVKTWHSRYNETGGSLQRALTVAPTGDASVQIKLTRPLRGGMHVHGSDKQWEDY
jgi:plastocyanin